MIIFIENNRIRNEIIVAEDDDFRADIIIVTTQGGD